MSESRVQVISKDRPALMVYCANKAAEWGTKSRTDAQDVGLAVAKRSSHDEVKMLTRCYLFSEWMSHRWNSLVGIVEEAQYEGTAYDVVCDFASRTRDEHVALACEHIESSLTRPEPQLMAGALAYWAGHQSTARPPMGVSEREKLIAKLTENTVKIGPSSVPHIHPGASAVIMLNMIEPTRVTRLAFGDDCKGRLHICHVRFGGYKNLVQDVSAEAFGDPGALIDDPQWVYPGMNIELRLENRSGDVVVPIFWIAGETVDPNCIRGVTASGSQIRGISTSKGYR